jgi:Cdc6-like AAA superfamily ATPase
MLDELPTDFIDQVLLGMRPRRQLRCFEAAVSPIFYPDTQIGELKMNRLLKEISDWSIEAKDEDTSSYFFHFDDVGQIESGEKNYVIGRKGTGKTAIAEYLHSRKDYNRFSRLLSFKNFPFNSLYDLADSNYTRPNQYISVWKYVIFHYICAMMAENAAVGAKCDFDLKKAFNFEVKGALTRSVRAITSREYNLSILGFGAGSASTSEATHFDFPAANSTLADFIIDKIDESEYYVIFDELDEDYRDVLNPDRRAGYFELLISLFKAAQSIRSELRGCSVNIVILLRDDIFDLCRDNDKNKWLDRAIFLKWDEAQLRNLINFRLARAAEICEQDISNTTPWDSAFSFSSIKWGHKKKRPDDALKYLISRTFGRPRDLISYVREAARVADSRKSERIDRDAVMEALDAHSAYMKREVIDEIFPVMDEVAEVLDVISRMRKIIFTKKEFNDRFREFQNSLPAGSRSKLTETQILKILYHFGVIGNVITGGHRIFAYNSDNKVLDFDKSFCVHNGLLKTLKIV